jgi:hypothetical protein
MGIKINQHRGSIGRHYFASLTVKKSLRLTVVDVFCFILFARYSIQALPLMTFCSLFNFNARLPCEIRESVAGRKSVEPTFDSDSSVIDICKYRYLFFVLCILLIISGIEINPGPSVASVSSSSVSSAESLLSNMSNLMTNSVSFLHLNIQSIVSKLDFIVAEYRELVETKYFH